MKLSLILESVQDQIQTLASKHRQDPNTIIDTCKKIGEKYWKWVLKQWYSGTIILPEDSHRVQEALQNFQKAYHRLPPNQKDINKYKRVSDLEAVVEPLLGVSSSAKSHDFAELPGVEVVNQEGPYTTIRVSDPESLKELGEGTKWCTKGSYPNCMAEESIKDHGHLFIILQNGRPVVQYTPNYDDIKDFNNKEIDDPKLLNLIPEPPLSADVFTLIGYAKNVIGDRWPEIEPIVIKDRAAIFDYARDVIEGRWPEGESVLINHTPTSRLDKNYWIECLFNYAKYVFQPATGHRWLEAEPYIAQKPQLAYYYAATVIGDRWPEAEEYIKQDPRWWQHYKNLGKMSLDSHKFGTVVDR